MSDVSDIYDTGDHDGSDDSGVDQHYDQDHSDQGSDEAGPDLSSDADYYATSDTDSAAGLSLADVGAQLDADAASYDPDEGAGGEPLSEHVVVGILWPAEDVDVDQLVANVLDRLGIAHE
jgi:hypothetical protein